MLFNQGNKFEANSLLDWKPTIYRLDDEGYVSKIPIEQLVKENNEMNQRNSTQEQTIKDVVKANFALGKELGEAKAENTEMSNRLKAIFKNM